MIIRCLLPLALLLSWSAAPLLAQGVKVAGDPAPTKTDEPKKEEPKPKKKAAAKSAKSKKKAAESKYKSHALAEGTESSYRFDESANPVGGAKKKSSSEKAAKKKSSDDSDEKKSEKCSSEEPCADKPTESDAL